MAGQEARDVQLIAFDLQEAVNSALAVTQALSNEIADGQRKLLSLVAAGNPKSLDSMAAQQANGPLGGLHEMVLITSCFFLKVAGLPRFFPLAFPLSESTLIHELVPCEKKKKKKNRPRPLWIQQRS